MIFTTLQHLNYCESHLAKRLAAVYLVLVAASLALLPASPAHAQETSSIPLDTIGDGPQAGTLANGVDWTVNVGTWIAPQGYVAFPPDTQVWTFDPEASLRFGIAGLNGSGECVRVPDGTIPESIHDDHVWNPAQRLICVEVANPGAESIFILGGPQSGLALEIVNTPGFGRGPTFIEVTVPPVPPPVQPRNVPVNAWWMLALLAGLIALVGARRSRPG